MKTGTLVALKAILEGDQPRTRADKETLLRTLGLGDNCREPDPGERVVSFAEAAQRLSRSKRSLHHLCKRGVLRKSRVPGCSRATGFLASDIETLLKNSVREGDAA